MTQEIKMKSFVAIDFETANQYRSSVCSVGVVVVKDNKIIDKFYSLIHPAPNYYSYWNTQVHGLTIDSTQSAPNFPDVWANVSPLIGDLPLVAHNSSFDESCLKAVFMLMECHTRIMHSTAHAGLRELFWAINFQITNSKPWHNTVAMIWKPSSCVG